MLITVDPVTLTVRACCRSSYSYAHSYRGGETLNVSCRSASSPISRRARYPRWHSSRLQDVVAAARIRVRALSDRSGSPPPEPINGKLKPAYHPSEDIDEHFEPHSRLTDAETARTVIEVNSKGTVIFSGIIDGVHENIFWPDAPYLTDEYGDIYFEANGNQDILQSLTSDDKLVQVIIGMDNVEVLNELELAEPPGFEFDMIDMTDNDSDSDDDYEGELVSILEDDENNDDEDDEDIDEDDEISPETIGDWANLETMQSSHPVYFAKRIAEAVSDSHMDWMEQPSAGLILQGLLRPVFVDENKTSKYPLVFKRSDNDAHQLGEVVQNDVERESDAGESLHSRTAFYKLELINMQLVSACGNQSTVKVEAFRKAKPDVLAHSAANIISRLKGGGEKMTQAFKSLCWRHRGIQVEEASITGVDSLGFDLRVCSGTQIQTLRFAFNTRATSEYSAERQLHDLLFPKYHKQQMIPQPNQKDN